ncbi:hypothetical protein EDC04DRAFT_2686353 [Pisolithus marmoratus]|nr:hypothetical protein EDC04DRAFT_2686353 [Pisolithus marmoratus]
MLASSTPPSPHARSLLDMGCPPISESARPSTVQLSPRVHVPQASSVRPKSTHGQVRPAHTRPAFTPHPSLPSLRTLAQMNVVVPRKVRKGTVGARLPHEPWDLDLSAESLSALICLPLLKRKILCWISPPAGLPPENEAEGRQRRTLPVISVTKKFCYGEEDLLSYHSDFDYYYTQSLSDSSDSEQDCPESTQNVGGTPSPRGSWPSSERAPTTYHPRIPHDEHEWHEQRGTLDRCTSAGDRRGLGQEMYRQVSRRSSSRAGKDQGSSRGDRHHTRGPSSGATSDCSLSSTSEDTSTASLNGPSRTHSPIQSRIPRAGGGSDDDVPLAQRMPTALKAQKSIRQQLRDERHQRKADRARSRKRSASSAAPPRTASSQPSPIPPEDLSRKLMQLQTSASSSAEQNLATSFARKARLVRSTATSPTQGRHPECPAYMQQSTTRSSEAPSQNQSLKTAHSLHRPDRRHAESSRQAFETTSAQPLGRSITVGARHIPDDIHGRASTEGKARSARTGRDTHAGHEPAARSGRVSEDNGKPSGSLTRPSIDRESNKSNQRVAQRPPLPAPLPPTSISAPPLQSSKVSVTQQRIFIGDMQRFNTVEITSNTTAGDVVKLMTSQGILDKSGTWMLFELAQDYGMERPVRDYELLSDVSDSWDKDKLLNAFVIKPTPMARLLSPSAIPSCSPTHRGWIEWESKRGKWSKRWMELREHGIWLSKRDTGKDETFLCSMSNFDAYHVTRRHKSPKPFVFAIKSTDHLSLFENAADYLHVFSCNQRDGEKWMEAILVARSYVLHQEKHVLCTRPVESASQAKPLSRTRTRKQSVSSRPAQPLINVPPPFSVSPTANVVFEPGSLLAKCKGDSQT